MKLESGVNVADELQRATKLIDDILTSIRKKEPLPIDAPQKFAGALSAIIGNTFASMETGEFIKFMSKYGFVFSTIKGMLSLKK